MLSPAWSLAASDTKKVSFFINQVRMVGVILCYRMKKVVGIYGGRFVPETLMPVLLELTAAYATARDDISFQSELESLSHSYSGRPTPLYFAASLTEYCNGAKIYLKREDLGTHRSP